MINHQVVTMSTEDKILAATISLLEKKGYLGVTTKEIAQTVGFSEMTLFRKFGSKKAILKASVKKYSYNLSIKNFFEKEMIYDLEHDLTLISKTYQKYMNENRKVMLIALKDPFIHPDLHENVSKHQKIFRNIFTRVFE